MKYLNYTSIIIKGGSVNQYYVHNINYVLKYKYNIPKRYNLFILSEIYIF